MNPCLRNGDEVILDQRRAWPGDIVALRCRGEIVLHRFLGVRPFSSADGSRMWLAVTKPDNDPRFDPEVERSSVVGVVVARRERDGESSPLRPSPVQRLRSQVWFLRYLASRLRSRAARSSSAIGRSAGPE